MVLLNEREKVELMEQLKVLPGHKAKLMSLIDMIKDVRMNEISYILGLLCLKCWSGIRLIKDGKSSSVRLHIRRILSGLIIRVIEQLENT